MTVKDLREILCAYPENREIVLAKDAEGNDFSPAADHDAGFYAARTDLSGDVSAQPSRGSKEVMVLWPRN